MTLAEKIFALVGSAVLLVTFAGLVVRERWRLWYAFALYLLVVAGFSIGFVALPDWYQNGPYVLQTNVVNVVRLAMALELRDRTFRAFPGAHSTLQRLLLLLLVTTLVVLIVVPTQNHDYEGFLSDIQPRLLNATAWIFTAIAALILWYRLPVHPFHKSILMPYVPYLLWDAVYLNAFFPTDGDTPVLRNLNQVVYLAVVSRWAWVAWRVDVGSESKPPRTLPDDELEPPRRHSSLIATST